MEGIAKLEDFIEKRRRTGLVPKKVRVTRGGKTFEQTRLVRPEEVSRVKLRIRSEAEKERYAEEEYGIPKVDEMSAAMGISVGRLIRRAEDPNEPEQVENMRNLFGFVSFYGRLADPDIRVTDGELKKVAGDTLPRVERLKNDAERWMKYGEETGESASEQERFRKLWAGTNEVVEGLRSRDRLDKVIAVDKLVNLAHTHWPSALPDLFDVNPIQVENKRENVLIRYFDWLASEEERKMEKSFIAIRKKNREELPKESTDLKKEAFKAEDKIRTVTFLGTGPTTPVEGEGRNRRLNNSSLITLKDGKRILIECTPFVTEQLQAEKIDWVDAILISHGHSDAIGGIAQLSDVINGRSTVYAEGATWKIIRKRFADLSYIEQVTFTEGKKFEINDLEVVPFRIHHAIQDTEEFPCVGFNFNDGEFVYLVG